MFRRHFRRLGRQNGVTLACSAKQDWDFIRGQLALTPARSAAFQQSLTWCKFTTSKCWIVILSTIVFRFRPALVLVERLQWSHGTSAVYFTQTYFGLSSVALWPNAFI